MNMSKCKTWYLWNISKIQDGHQDCRYHILFCKFYPCTRNRDLWGFYQGFRARDHIFIGSPMWHYSLPQVSQCWILRKLVQRWAKQQLWATGELVVDLHFQVGHSIYTYMYMSEKCCTRGRILVQVTIYRRFSDWSRWPSRPIRSLRYIVTCTRIRVQGTNVTTLKYFCINFGDKRSQLFFNLKAS